MSREFLFSSESVGEGHPDKIADQISDALLDAIIEQDPGVIAGIETIINTGFVLVGGEVTGKYHIPFDEIVRKTVLDIGYDSSEKGFDGATCGVINTMEKQSQDLTSGIFPKSTLKNHGAGDQGMMFGYACCETKEYFPLSLSLAHQLAKKTADLRKSGPLNFLWPDCKTQVTLKYKGNQPVSVEKVVISSQHSPETSLNKIKDSLIEEVVKKIIPEELISPQLKYFINSTGRFVTGGPQGDLGMTGRKIIVDSYGGHGSHGGGAFSGKDPSKTDRSGAYMARYLAKNLVAAGLMEKCSVQLAYAIAIDEPMSVHIEDFGTTKVPIHEVEAFIQKRWSFVPKDIIDHLELRKPRYRATASYGHFGRESEQFTWEKLDRVEELKGFFF